MANLYSILNSDVKSDFFSRISSEQYGNLPADLLTIFEGLEGDRRPYIAFDTISVSQQFCEAIRIAGENFWILAKAYSEIIANLSPDEICDWGLPEDYIPYIMSDKIPPCEMRLDIAVNPDAFNRDWFELGDFKVLEANSATPGLWFETFVLNGLICNHFGKKCPNTNLGKDQTLDFIKYLKVASNGRFNKAKDTIHFSFPYSGNHEDILSFDARIGFLQQEGYKAEFHYTDKLVLETDPLKDPTIYTPNGEVIKYLFIHYPNEWMIEDQGNVVVQNDNVLEPNARPWDYILQLIIDKNLIKLPPISSDVIQNKGILAMMWNGVTNNSIDDDTASAIQTLIPPTFCTFEEAEGAGLTRVWEKPIYGREGAGVILYVDGNEAVNTYDPQFDEDGEWYKNMLAVYQQDCKMPTKQFDDTDITLMFTVYISALGKATGISCRATKGLGETAIDAGSGIWYPLSLK